MAVREEVLTAARSARTAARILASTDTGLRNAALESAALALESRAESILAANREDRAEAEAGGELSPASLARLKVDPAKLKEMATGIRAVAALPDPLGRLRLHRRLDEGLELTQVTCPLGVLGVIFESRPDALAQIGALALKSGNAVLLKGGREARRTNAALAAAIREALGRHSGLPQDALQLLEDREAVDALLDLPEYVDLVIPRGSNALVRYIQGRTRIPVLGHADGVCHVYLDAAADPAMAVAIALDAKTQYPAACNAAETLLIHAQAAPRLLPLLVPAFESAKVELRGCGRCRAAIPAMKPATEEDWGTEYGDLILSVKIVDSVDEAIAHIHAFGSGHTETIVTEDAATAERFLRDVDAAGVYHNASTRFADGYRYGFGAEVGISTGKLHARGPVGLEGLVTTKYLLRGHGQTVREYSGPDAKPFRHEDLPI